MINNRFLDCFGRVYVASGSLGIDGKGYYYDKFLSLIPGHNFRGATLITKTITVDARDGNLPLKKNLQPRSKWPNCIKVYPFSGHVMNAVGIPSPGLKAVLDSGVWYNIENPFLISIIPVRKTKMDRIKEIETAVELLGKNCRNFKTIFEIQLNVSCPNIGIDIYQYINEVQAYISILYEAGFLVDLKVNVLIPPECINALHSYQMVTCSNTIPFGAFPDEINWKKFSGLEQYGGGGLSGPILLPYVIDWIKRFREIDRLFPLKACGGIFSKRDVDKVIEAGADAIEIGIVKLMRPWKIKGIINRMKKYDQNRRINKIVI